FPSNSARTSCSSLPACSPLSDRISVYGSRPSTAHRSTYPSVTHVLFAASRGAITASREPRRGWRAGGGAARPRGGAGRAGGRVGGRGGGGGGGGGGPAGSTPAAGGWSPPTAPTRAGGRPGQPPPARAGRRASRRARLTASGTLDRSSPEPGGVVTVTLASGY